MFVLVSKRVEAAKQQIKSPGKSSSVSEDPEATTRHRVPEQSPPYKWRGGASQMRFFMYMEGRDEA